MNLGRIISMFICFIALYSCADYKTNKGTQKVKISDIDMPFVSMIVFMVKWAIASIPAILILMVLFFIFGGLLGILT